MRGYGVILPEDRVLTTYIIHKVAPLSIQSWNLVTGWAAGQCVESQVLQAGMTSKINWMLACRQHEPLSIATAISIRTTKDPRKPVFGGGEKKVEAS